jgi:tRNA U34 2-thiouridine synthase MnmA/TrmU
MSLTKKAVALLSGGMDSTLAVKLMIDQGIDVTAVHFTSMFCNKLDDHYQEKKYVYTSKGRYTA